MASNIDPTKPESGVDQSSSVLRNNFAYAKVEIEDLQNNKASLKDGLLQLPILANGSIPAASSHQGCIVYSSTSNIILYSNGSNWIDLTSGAVVI